MSPEEHEAMIRRYIAEVFNRHDLDGLDQYWATDLVSHWMGQETWRGLPVWRDGMVDFFAGCPDASSTLDDLFFAGDQGVWRASGRATQRGAWQGVAASGREEREIFRGLLTCRLDAYDRFVGIRNGVSAVCSQEAPWSAVAEGPEA